MKRILGLFLLCFAYCNIAHALPTGYTQLEYIESTGTQCINTGVTLTSDNVVYEWEAKDNSIINNHHSTTLFGSESGENPTFTGLLYNGSGGRGAYTGSTWGANVGYVPDDDFNSWRFVINSDHTQYLVKDGVKKTTVAWSGTLNKIKPIALFCNLYRGQSYAQYAKAVFKYFRIIDNGNVVFYGIPARRNSDNVIGMYDTISDTFKTNIGSGTFLAGNEIEVGIASTSYVAGMHEAINTTKQNKLTSTGANPNVIVTGDANGIVSSFTANNGIVTVTRSAVTLPWGAENSNNRAEVWVD